MKATEQFRQLSSREKERVKVLQTDLTLYERAIKRHAEDGMNYYMKAGALSELSKYMIDKADCLKDALECYNKAIELSVDNPLYLADRMKLCHQNGLEEVTAEDIDAVKKLNDSNDVTEIYIRNTLQDIEQHLEKAQLDVLGASQQADGTGSVFEKS